MSYEPVPPMETLAPTTPDRKGLAIAALVCGILGFCGSWFPGCSTLLAIAAVILGAISIKSTGKVMAIIGLVLGIISLCLSIVLLILVGIPFISNGFNFNDILYQLGF